MNESPPPFFSIVVPFFNRAHLISKLVTMISNQTFSEWELLLIDDGSTDGSAEVFSKIAIDPRLKYVLKKHGGVSETRNVGIGHATGEYVFFLDSDDTLHPESLRHFHSCLIQLDYDMAFASVRIVKDGVERFKRPANLGRVFNNVVGLFLAGAFCVRRKLLLSVGGFESTLKFSENFELGIRLCGESQKAIIVEFVSIDYVISTSTRTSNLVTNKLNANLFILERHAQKLLVDRFFHSRLLSQTGYYFKARGSPRTARDYFLRSFRLNPFNMTNVYRFILSFV